MYNLRASMMMILAMAGFAAEDAVIKHLAGSMPVGQIMIALGIGGTLMFGGLARLRGKRLLVADALRGAVLVRNLCEILGAGGVVLAISLVPLATVTAILQSMPLVVTLGAALFLGEAVGWRRWGAILVGFAGVLIILRPGGAGFDPAALIAVLAVLGLAGRDLATRRVPVHVDSLQLSGWGFAMLVPAGLVLSAFGSAPVVPSMAQWAWLVSAMVFGTVAYGALVAATRLGDIAATVPFRYTRLLFAMIIGLVFFGERPESWTLAGAALIVGAGLFSFWRELRLRRQISDRHRVNH
ncbi:MAG: DMT family transporter [Pararhodobacter sp.]